MVYLRAAIATIIGLLVVLAGYILISFDDQYELKLAYDQYAVGNYEESTETLNKLHYKNLEAQKHLYLSYIERDQGYFKNSNESLEKAAEASKTDKRSNLQLEILINQILNSYIDDNPKQMNLSLQKAQKLLAGRQNDWIDFFTSVQNNLSTQNNDDNQIEEYWKNVGNNTHLSYWMKRSFQNIFTPFWQKTKHIRNLISQGKYVEARQIIEKALEQQNESQRDDLTMLMGLSYVEEAKEKPENASTPYYKLAFSYYSRIPFHHKKFNKDRNDFFEVISGQISNLISTQKYQNLPFYLSVLEQLEEEQEKNQLSESLLNIVTVELEKENWQNVNQIVTLLNRMLSQGPARKHLEDQLKEQLVTAIESGSPQDIKKYWNVTMILSSNENEIKSQYLSQLESRILTNINNDSEELYKSYPLIQVWNGIDKESNQRKDFLNQIVSKSTELWDAPNEYEKATKILVVALEITNQKEKGFINELIKENLKEVYASAFQNENYTKIQNLFEATQKLNFDKYTLVSREDEKKYTREAQLFFSNKKFGKAESLSNWILTFSPKNNKALIINGLTNYYKGDYLRSDQLLNQVKTSNKEINQALAVSKIVTGNKRQGQQILDKLSRKGSISPSVYLRIGFGELQNNSPQNAIEWFSKIPNQTPEVVVGLALAEHQRENWSQAYEYIETLNFPFSQLDLAQSIKVQSLIRMDKISEAEKSLNQFLSSEDTSTYGEFSDSFNILLQKTGHQFDRYLTTSMFYDEGKNNPKEALEYLSKIETPSASILLAKGRIQIKLGKNYDAKKSLQSALTLAKESTISSEILSDILPNLAYVTQKLGQNIESFIYFEDYFNQYPDQNQYRPEYVTTLMSVRRYDLALQQLTTIRNTESFKPTERVAYIESLIHTNQFSKANKDAQKWIKEDPNIDTIHLIKIAQAMVKTKNNTLIEKIINQISAIDHLSSEEAVEFLNLYIFLGDSEKGKTLIVNNLDLFESSSSGLMALANYNSYYGNSENVIKYANMALKIDPSSQKIQEFIAIHQPTNNEDAAFNVDSNLFTENNLLNIENIDRSIAIITRKINEAYSEIQNNPQHHVETSSSIELLQPVVDKLSSKIKSIPEIFYLSGKLHYLLNNMHGSKEAYRKAINLDISYSNAYQYLALVYFKNAQLNEAKKQLSYSVKFTPNNSNAWLFLGVIEEEDGALFDSINAYQNSIKYKPNNPVPYLMLGKLELEVNNPEAAKKSLDNSLRLNPNNVTTLKLLLKTLYNPHLYMETTNDTALVTERQKVHDKLHELAPEELKALIEELDADGNITANY
ncbi:MAG: hypothetical protein VX777_06910 [Chlamydiota bacterium]|nr:hypothetical protein [Chlamydiota bacterium]